MLSKTDYLEMLKTFDTMTNLFKHYMFKYNDKLQRFLEFELNKIPYFRQLTNMTKQELIYSMERETFEKGQFICKKD